MTPKEKAEELVGKYQSGYTIHGFNYQFLNDLQDAKQCALIAANEILNQYWSHDTKRRDWWQEVKQEIEKL
jgi:hypothetical protein